MRRPFLRRETGLRRTFPANYLRRNYARLFHAAFTPPRSLNKRKESDAPQPPETLIKRHFHPDVSKVLHANNL